MKRLTPKDAVENGQSMVYMELARINMQSERYRSFLSDCIRRLAAYEDLGDYDRLCELAEADKDGRCVVLPCKVGTRVWVIGQNCDLCHDMYAEEPCLFGSCEYKEVFESVFGYGMIDNFGKTVFHTRAEAEAALKEAENEQT